MKFFGPNEKCCVLEVGEVDEGDFTDPAAIKMLAVYTSKQLVRITLECLFVRLMALLAAQHSAVPRLPSHL